MPSVCEFLVTTCIRYAFHSLLQSGIYYERLLITPSAITSAYASYRQKSPIIIKSITWYTAFKNYDTSKRTNYGSGVKTAPAVSSTRTQLVIKKGSAGHFPAGVTAPSSVHRFDIVRWLKGRELGLLHSRIAKPDVNLE